MLTLLLALGATAQEPDRTAALMASPIGPAVSVVGTALGSPTFDATLRFHHAPTPGIGWTLQTDTTISNVFDMRVSYAGVRGGPRFSLRRRGLDDWTLTPFVSAGVSTLSALDQRLARYGVLAAGVEAGRTWVWNRFTMEIGLGAYASVPVGFATPAEALADEPAPSLFPIKPTVTWSVGYAF